MEIDKMEAAQDLFFGAYNCAQSVLAAFAGDYGMSREMALKVSCGFGAGMGRLQTTCGAVTGAVMVIGLQFGKSAEDENDRKELTYSKVRELIKRFEKRFGSTTCLQMVNNCNFNTGEGEKKYEDEQLQLHVCNEAVKYAVEILKDILEE